MKKWWSIVGLLLPLVFALIFWPKNTSELVNPLGEQMKKELPYEKYTFVRLAERGGIKSEINYEGNVFYYQSEGRKISGQVNFPEGEVRGVIVMARGYVDKEIYQTGMGTKNAAQYYAKNGYFTYAPDFSGYGGSDQEDVNAIGARLTKPVEILDLLASLETDLPIYLWGHSNGGQIMLSVAEILGMREDLSLQGPTLKGLTLWAPVTKPFPYSILFYTDEAEDKGKWLRRELARFETEYDVYNYSIDRYFDKIKLPIQLHQGTADEAVPKRWSDEAVEIWEELEKEVQYYVYRGADHNLNPGWNTVVERDVSWFASL